MQFFFRLIHKFKQYIWTSLLLLFRIYCYEVPSVVSLPLVTLMKSGSLKRKSNCFVDVPLFEEYAYKMVIIVKTSRWLNLEWYMHHRWRYLVRFHCCKQSKLHWCKGFCGSSWTPCDELWCKLVFNPLIYSWIYKVSGEGGSNCLYWPLSTGELNHGFLFPTITWRTFGSLRLTMKEMADGFEVWSPG